MVRESGVHASGKTAIASSEGSLGIWSEIEVSTMLEFAGTKRCETRAAEVSQQSRGAAWLMGTLVQRRDKKGSVWGASSVHQLHASS